MRDIGNLPDTHGDEKWSEKMRRWQGERNGAETEGEEIDKAEMEF